MLVSSDWLKIYAINSVGLSLIITLAKNNDHSALEVQLVHVDQV